jgi:hypothetical protein
MAALRKLSDLFYRVSSRWTVLAAVLVYGFFIATIMPAQSIESAAYAGDWGAPDRHLFYTPDTLYAAISQWGADGRQSYINFRLGLDILWALAYTAFLITCISCLLRLSFGKSDWQRLLNVWPLITLVCDYTENALGILLVTNYPTRMDPLAWLATASTTTKWVSLVLAHILLASALIYALRNWLKRAKSHS